MKIEKMKATYGVLSGAELCLGPGLNIIQAPNESGKSTWCAFLRAMLYGVSTSDREKAGYLPDKKRYSPWQGGAMQGSMELLHEGKQITLERSSRGAAPMQKVVAVYRGTFDRIPELEGPGAGEALTGVSEAVFERTAFIGQSGVRVNQSPELEHRISSIVSSGEEAASYSETDARLRALRRELNNDRGGGRIPKAEAALAERRNRLQELQRRNGELGDLRQSRDRLTAQVRQLEEDLEIHKKLAVRTQGQKVLDARKSAKQARADAEFLRSTLRYRGRQVEPGDLGEVRAAYASVETLAAACVAAKRLSDDAQTVHATALESRNKFRFADHDETRVADAARRAGELAGAAAAEAARPKHPYRKYLPLALSGIALILALIFRTLPVILPCAAAFAAGIVGFGILSRRKEATPAGDELQQILKEFSYPGVEVFLRDAGTYATACVRESTLRAAAAQAKERYLASRDAATAAAAAAVAKARELEPNLADVAAIPALLKATEESMARLHTAENEAAARESAYETLSAAYPGNVDQEDFSYLPVPMRSRADTASALEHTRQRLAEDQRQLTLAEGSLRVSGDPVVLGAEIDRLEEDLAVFRQQLKSLDAAIAAMKDASAELQTRFSPRLGKTAGAYMARLTGGRYDKLTFDKSFAAAASPAGDDVARSALYLSVGTADQLYLSLRLAMCDLMLAGSEPCPVILDDVLASFDDARAARALQLLQELAAHRQILLFTCHTREATQAAAWPGVTIVTM